MILGLAAFDEAGPAAPKLGRLLVGTAAFLPLMAQVFPVCAHQSLNRLCKPLAMARTFCKALSRPAWPVDAGSTRLLANLVSQPEQGPVQPQLALLVQLHHAPQQPAR